MEYYFVVSSPVGPLTLSERDGKLTGLDFGNVIYPHKEYLRTELLSQAGSELDEYFSGNRRTFDLPLEFMGGTVFQRRVWEFLLTVPYGQTASYSEAAANAGNPKAVRAAGGAVGRNPIAIIVPCHRILGKDGSITGFSGGKDKKRYLLALEGIKYI